MRTEKSIGTALGASIRCWPMTAPASGAAVVSTIVTIATASGVRVTFSRTVRVPVTEAFAASNGTANTPARNGDDDREGAGALGTRADGRHGSTSSAGGREHPPPPEPDPKPSRMNPGRTTRAASPISLLSAGMADFEGAHTL